MTQMSSSGRFVPKEYEVDYEQEPCYAHYGLKHGTLTRYSDDLENESYRTAIQVRIKTTDFVRKYADELKIRMSGLEFLSLVNQWAKIQKHSKKNQDKFMVQQNLLPQYKYSRDLAINVRYRVIFYNLMTAKQFNNSVREMDKGKNTLKNMYHAMSQPGHPKPLVIDSLTGNKWYGVVPEEVINLDNKP